MRAAVGTTYRNASLLTVAEVEAPTVGDGELLIGVRAAGLSPGDRALVTGVPYVNRLAGNGVRRPRHPIPGADVAGVVEAVGPAVTRFAVGDEVFGSAPGAFAELVAADEDQVVLKPSNWTFVEAATVPESGCVALQAVRDQAGVRPGHRVAVLGAGGGVGSFAVQLAKLDGAEVTAVCGPRMVGDMGRLGADHVLDYRVDRLTETGDHYDAIIDTAGRSSLGELRAALTAGGRLVIVGADHGRRISGGLGRWLRAMMWSPLVEQRLRPFVAHPMTQACLLDLVGLMERDQLVPMVDRTFPLESIGAAMRYLDHRQHAGKVVLTVDRGGQS